MSLSQYQGDIFNTWVYGNAPRPSWAAPMIGASGSRGSVSQEPGMFPENSELQQMVANYSPFWDFFHKQNSIPFQIKNIVRHKNAVMFYIPLATGPSPHYGVMVEIKRAWLCSLDERNDYACISQVTNVYYVTIQNPLSSIHGPITATLKPPFSTDLRTSLWRAMGMFTSLYDDLIAEVSASIANDSSPDLPEHLERLWRLKLNLVG